MAFLGIALVWTLTVGGPRQGLGNAQDVGCPGQADMQRLGVLILRVAGIGHSLLGSTLWHHFLLTGVGLGPR